MDFTGVWRDKNDGGSIGTSFGSINYGNIYQTNLSEFRLSMQNSRVGARFDSMVKGAGKWGITADDGWFENVEVHGLPSGTTPNPP